MTATVRASRSELPRALATASANLERRADARALPPPRRAMIALQRCEPLQVELAVCQLAQPNGSLDTELAEIPAGRYLTLDSTLATHELATVLPRMRDWLGEHREGVAGPLFVELVDGRLVVRQRIIGGVPQGKMKPLADDALSAVAQAMQRASSQLDLAC